MQGSTETCCSGNNQRQCAPVKIFSSWAILCGLSLCVPGKRPQHSSPLCCPAYLSLRNRLSYILKSYFIDIMKRSLNHFNGLHILCMHRGVNPLFFSGGLK